MTPIVIPLQELVIALSTLALFASLLLYWLYQPEYIDKAVVSVFRFILRILSYPLTLVCITIIFALTYIATIANYTIRRFTGPLPTGFKLRVSFDD